MPIFFVLLSVLLVWLSLVDLREMRIPNALNAALAISGAAHGWLIGSPNLLDGSLGAAVGGATLYAVATSYQRLKKIAGLGLGDVKLFAASGFWLGWQGLAPALLIAALSALAFVGLRAGVTGAFDPRRRLPFGPFLSVGIFASFVFPLASFYDPSHLLFGL